MSDGPPIVAVEDDLRAIERAVEGDPETAVAQAREKLAAFDAREAGGQVSLLDDVETFLLRAQEQVTGEPERCIAAVRNRLGIYRDALSRTDEDLAVIDSHLRSTDEAVGDSTSDEWDLSALHGRDAELVATVLNAGADRRVVLVVGFYDESGDELREVTTEAVPLEADEQRVIDVDVTVPEGTAYYAATALDADRETVR